MRPPTRVGIATGLVVVSDLIGSGACQEQAIVGETPGNLSLLQNLATSAMPATISPAPKIRHPFSECVSIPNKPK